jgi:hypothetical protein
MLKPILTHIIYVNVIKLIVLTNGIMEWINMILDIIGILDIVMVVITYHVRIDEGTITHGLNVKHAVRNIV